MKKKSWKTLDEKEDKADSDRAMKAYGGSGGIFTLILNFGTEIEW
jgi:hypothetical protein